MNSNFFKGKLIEVGEYQLICSEIISQQQLKVNDFKQNSYFLQIIQDMSDEDQKTLELIQRIKLKSIVNIIAIEKRTLKEIYVLIEYSENNLSKGLEALGIEAINTRNLLKQIACCIQELNQQNFGLRRLQIQDIFVFFINQQRNQQVLKLWGFSQFQTLQVSIIKYPNFSNLQRNQDIQQLGQIFFQVIFRIDYQLEQSLDQQFEILNKALIEQDLKHLIMEMLSPQGKLNINQVISRLQPKINKSVQKLMKSNELDQVFQKTQNFTNRGNSERKKVTFDLQSNNALKQEDSNPKITSKTPEILVKKSNLIINNNFIQQQNAMLQNYQSPKAQSNLLHNCCIKNIQQQPLLNNKINDQQRQNIQQFQINKMYVNIQIQQNDNSIDRNIGNIK